MTEPTDRAVSLTYCYQHGVDHTEQYGGDCSDWYHPALATAEQWAQLQVWPITQPFREGTEWETRSAASWLVEAGALAQIAKTATDQATTAVRFARRDGASWATIGTALGITRQAAQQRYGQR